MVDQGSDTAGQRTWQEREFVRKCNAAERFIRDEITGKDEHFFVRRSTLTIASGATSVAVPDDCVGIVKMVIRSSAGDHTGEELRLLTGAEVGSTFGAYYRPMTTTLEFPLTPNESLSVELYYLGEHLPLAHGVVVDAGATTLQVASYELRQDSAYNTQTIYIVSGTGSNQSRVVTAYVGTTQVATVAAWGTVPDVTSVYSTRPDLPWQAQEAFKLKVAIDLLAKPNDERYEQYAGDFQVALAKLMKTIGIGNRARLKRVRNDRGVILGDPFPAGVVSGAGSWRR